ncbi:MAG: hypothetical protein AB3N63_10780 [Puniceicoccaceae bacterium]
MKFAIFSLIVSITASICQAGDALGWLKQEAMRQLSGCRVPSESGVILHTPDGIGHYKALWTRDFYYMIKYAPDLMDNEELKASIAFLLEGQREDGCIPDRVNAQEKAIYSPGGENNPLADHALDNAPFLALALCEYVKITGDLDFFRKVEPAVKRGLDHIRRAENGLVYNPPESPECVYGFTDIVTKTGNLLFSSALYYLACNEMATTCREADHGKHADYEKRALRIKKNIGVLWNEDAGMFFAADVDCRQLDIWGSAYVVDVGLATNEQANRVSKFLVENSDSIFQHGQVRHLPGKETWDRLFVDFHPEGSYQNGAFWATPLPWIVPVVARNSPTLARKLVDDCIRDFKTNGVAECINGEDRKVPNFVVSITNLYAAYSNLE